MNDETPDRSQFKRTLVRVLSIQVITLVLLGIVQYVLRPR